MHALVTPIDGCTHVQEGRWVVRRDDDGVSFQVEMRGGVLDSQGVFRPQYPSGRPTEMGELGTFMWTETRRLDFMQFQTEFEASDTEPERALEERFFACALAYLQAVQLGQRPVTEPEPEEEPEQ